ncbi:hypothetical protein LT493_24100 [Streptomyces tricolor]|nr:hypothetical protein [Streptomyces tricolor]
MEDLNETLGSRRSRSGLGLSNRSGGLVLGYLVAEVMRRAADPGSAYWPVADFQRLLLTEDEELFAAAGRQDFGLLHGPRAADSRGVTVGPARPGRDAAHPSRP